MSFHDKVHFLQYHPTVIKETIVFMRFKNHTVIIEIFLHYYDGISNEDLHSRFNKEFERKVNWERYDIGFCKEELFHDDGGDYILYDPDNEGQLVDTYYYGDFSGVEEGCYRLSDDDFVRK